MKFGSQLLEEIKNRIKVSDIVSKKVKLKPRGSEFVGLSPFSNEKTPSFTVSDEKGFYHCFSSGEHGSVFDFVMKTENLNFKEAVKKLANYAGITIEENIYQREDSLIKEKRKKLIDILIESNKWYQSNLVRELKSNKYLVSIFQKRNFNKKIINDFGLGFAPKNNDTLYNYLISKNFTTKDILDAGLIIISEKYKKKYDRFSNRIIFPIYDYFSNVVGFGGRALYKNQISKYVNSPSTIIYKKGDLLFGWQQCKNNLIKNKNELFIVEGYTDVISMYNIGYKNTLAPLGTALTVNQINYAWKICNEPTLCMDGDEAGQKASKRITELILPYLRPGYSINIVNLPSNEDPDSLVLSNNIQNLNNSLKNKITMIDFIWNNLIFGKTFNTPEKRAALEEEINRLVGLIKDFKVRKNYKNFFREKFFQEFKLSINNKFKTSEKKDLLNKKIINVYQISERILIGSIIMFPSLLNSIFNEFNNIDFKTQEFNNIKKFILKLFNSKKTIEDLSIRAKLSESEHDDIVTKIIDKSIFLHAPFLRNKNKMDLIIKGWNDYYKTYIERENNIYFKQNTNKLLNKLDEENFQKFKNYQSSVKKN